MGSPAPLEATQLLTQAETGDGAAAEQLMPLVYDELRRLAQHFLANERSDLTLQATAVVHEAYLRLIDQTKVEWQGRAHFFAIASKMMRRILIDHARASHTAKRGGGVDRVTLSDSVGLIDTKHSAVELMAIHEVLNQLGQLNERQAQVVELRFFAGLTIDEVAHVLGLSPRTVKDDWRFARAWLRSRLSDEQER